MLLGLYYFITFLIVPIQPPGCNIAINVSLRLCWSSLQQCCRYRAACDKRYELVNNQTTTDYRPTAYGTTVLGWSRDLASRHIKIEVGRIRIVTSYPIHHRGPPKFLTQFKKLECVAKPNLMAAWPSKLSTRRSYISPLVDQSSESTRATRLFD